MQLSKINNIPENTPFLFPVIFESLYTFGNGEKYAGVVLPYFKGRKTLQYFNLLIPEYAYAAHCFEAADIDDFCMSSRLYYLPVQWKNATPRSCIWVLASRIRENVIKFFKETGESFAGGGEAQEWDVPPGVPGVALSATPDVPADHKDIIGIWLRQVCKDLKSAYELDSAQMHYLLRACDAEWRFRTKTPNLGGYTEIRA